MIFNSYQWKKDLLKEKRRMQKINKKFLFDNFFEFAYHKFEKSLFCTAFIIRKLIESKKLTDITDNHKIQCKKYLPIKEITRINHILIDENYDFNNQLQCIVSGKQICNSLIHSYTCLLIFKEKANVIGFYVVSDYDKDKYLIEVPLKCWFEYIDLILKDNVTSIKMTVNKNETDYEVVEKK